jgi:hypothetical protein
MRKLKIALIGCCGFAFMAATTSLVSASPGGAKAKTEMFQKLTGGDLAYTTMVVSPALNVPVAAPELPAAVAFISDRSLIKLPVVKEISLRKRPGWRTGRSDNLHNRNLILRLKPPLIV